MKKLLMIAFHFPPSAMGSGHLRSLAFARYLPAHGWDPVVLSAHAAAYPRTEAANEALIPRDCRVHRALALDAGRHLAICGKYPGFMATPDRWASWWPMAVVQGLHLIRKHRIDAIWSTYPIMTAHHIAYTLSGLTKLPWIADFRDPVSGSVTPNNRFSLASQRRWEKRVMERASRVAFTTPSAMRSYAEQYPAVFGVGRMTVIPNGYDETAFAQLPHPAPLHDNRPLCLVHSGLLYPEGRNPLPFFRALANLIKGRMLSDGDIRVVLRASGSEPAYAAEIRRLGLDRIITLADPISNQEALREQSRSDGLLLFQGREFDHQIPAKVYEYLRVGRPILALVGAHGDAAALLRESGGALLASIDSVPDIEKGLLQLVDSLRMGRRLVVDLEKVRAYSRERGAKALADWLDGAS